MVVVRECMLDEHVSYSNRRAKELGQDPPKYENQCIHQCIHQERTGCKEHKAKF